MTDAEVRGAKLNHADLSKANRRGAKLVDDKRLEEQAASLDSAIMPDGSKHP